MNVSESAAAAQLPPDMVLPKRAEHVCADGRKVLIRSLRAAGFLRLAAVVAQCGPKDIPAALSPAEFLTQEQHAELQALTDPLARTTRFAEILQALTPEQKFLLKQSSQARLKAILAWVAESEEIVPVLFEFATDLNAAEFRELELPDLFAVLNKVLQLTDWNSTFQLLPDFFGQIAGIVTAAGRRSATSAAAAATAL